MFNRSLEEVGTLKRKLDKYKTREWMTAGDEVLLEEIKVYKVSHDLSCVTHRLSAGMSGYSVALISRPS